MKRKVLLVILDGWGIGAHDESNPVYKVNPKNIEDIKRRFPIGCLHASGIAIGLPWGEEGNSEVGHITLGAGKIIYQHFPRISLAIRDGSFFQNQILKNAFAHAEKNNSNVHLVGLLGSGNVHSSFEHLAALLEFAKRENFERLYLQLFTDGRDSPPRSAAGLLENLEKTIKEKNRGTLASLSGRFYALDRTRHWDRTERVYKILTDEGKTVANYRDLLAENYKRNLNDDFIEPTIIGSTHPIQDNDTVIFFEFREESPRQIVAAFAEPDFPNFPVKKFSNLHLVTMTRYDEKFNLPVVFPPDLNNENLGKILSDSSKIQLRIAETEKYAHVTFFFNGYRKEPFPNEFRVLVPSLNAPRYDQFPEMMAKTVTDRTISSVEEGAYDFILVNYANSDTMGHTGNYEAAVKTIKVIDEEIGRLLKAVMARPDTVMIITSDHGNIERMLDPLTGMMETKHDSNPVPFYLIGEEFERIKSEAETRKAETQNLGTLADVAPTVLALMGLPKPKTMTGNNILPFLTP
ncbi:MAG: 2,3-bisphosphoglycerate-independent phosphoglycerate mutase [Candidatus Paceibacterota bacterium]